ncbi:membrane-bound lytic murein transglycosylase B [Marmoricola sp. OAE513]|uniref:lytic transglycosylase domain-containing protein n=1 Tax=Marmoricola sp. OAE513 TaxID=2817894 RepID=UPI001D59E976
MIGSHPRLGFAVFGAVLVVLVGLGIFIVTAGGGATVPDDLTYEPAPQAAPVVPPANNVSRSSERKALPAGVDPAWAASTGAQVGIPARAMLAYGSAELRIDKEQKGCHLSWNTLAGIGWVESHHGTIDDRTVTEDGRTSTPIIGPALDGKQFAAIRSTPQSAQWHGDTTWEHAVGPLQFIASTWDRWGADGDRDGVADPLDLDDAAYTAARYLCADDHDLRTPTGWSGAVHSYNHDNQYVLNVLAAANSYAERATG